MKPTSESDDQMAQHLRQANERLAEQPAPKVRAAVLLAAAQRRAGAPLLGRKAAGQATTPFALQGATELGRGDPKPGQRWGAWLRRFSWRPPLAAGATALAGVLAVTIGLRVQQEQPDASGAAPAAVGEAVRPALRSGPVPAGAPAPTMSAPTPGASPPSTLAPIAPLPAAASKQSDAATAGASAAVGSAASAVDTGARLDLPAREAAQNALARAIPAPPALSAGQGGEMAEPASRALAPARDQQDASPEQSAAQGAQQRALTAAAHRQTPGPSVRSQLAELPEPWLQRIAQLRAEHRDDEADQELVRFAAKYPELEIPQSARRR